MSSTETSPILLAEANRTVRELMAEVLTDAGIPAAVWEEGADGADEHSAPAAEAPLVVVDMDAAPDGAEAMVARCQQQGVPVLRTGVANSPHREASQHWLSRPFAPETFLERCRDVAARRKLAAGYEGESTTDEIQYEDSELEALEDLHSETLDSDTDVEVDEAVEDDESGEILEIDDSSEMVLDVQDLDEEDLEPAQESVGRFGGATEAESLDVEGLRAKAEGLKAVRQTDVADPSDSASNPTVPEVPAYRKGVEDEGSAPESPEETSGAASTPGRVSRGTSGGDSGPRNPGSGLGRDGSGRVDSGEMPQITEGSAPGGGTVSSSMSGLSPDLERRTGAVADRIADAWNRIGLAARPADRADRIRRILEAALEQGMEAASGEIDRLPPADGFGGQIEQFSVRRLLRDVERRQRRGRLELSGQHGGGFVLFLDGGDLEDIEDLSGRGDGRLLEVLEDCDYLDSSEIEQYRRRLEDTLSAPLEMQLRTDSELSDDHLREARLEWARRLIADAYTLEGGNFAWVDVSPEDGQSWPVDGLGLDVQAAILEMLRDGELAVGADIRESQQIVVRAAGVHRFGPSKLSDVERRVVEEARWPVSIGELSAGGGDPEVRLRAAERLAEIGLVDVVDEDAIGETDVGQSTHETVIDGHAGEGLPDTAERPAQPGGDSPTDEAGSGGSDEHEKPTVPREAVDPDSHAEAPVPGRNDGARDDVPAEPSSDPVSEVNDTNTNEDSTNG